jgi:hypothetical protein
MGMRYSFWDLLTGEDGKLSLSKFQMSLWTMLYFTYSVVYMLKTGLPPELNRGAYLLMGISGATYLGAKTVRAAEKVKLASLQKQGAAAAKKE